MLADTGVQPWCHCWLVQQCSSALPLRLEFRRAVLTSREVPYLRNTRLAQAFAISTITVLVVLLSWSYATGGIVHVLFRSGDSAEEKVAALRRFFNQFGLAAPLAYVGFVIVEVVVAPIPGTMLYAPGGVLFGGFWGGLLSLSGNVIGAGRRLPIDAGRARRTGRKLPGSLGARPLQGSHHPSRRVGGLLAAD